MKRSALQSFAHSGDLGRVDEDGFFYVCGRIKELIVTAGGKTMPHVLVRVPNLYFGSRLGVQYPKNSKIFL